MSNLGGYETAVRIIKQLGGPDKAAKYGVAAAGALLVTGAAGYAGLQKGVAVVKEKLKSRSIQCPLQGKTFEVHTNAQDGNGLVFGTGDRFTVLECDADAILIELDGNHENPHFVSGEFLTNISNFSLINPSSKN